MPRALKWIGLVVVAMTVLIAAVVVLLDANHLRGTVARLLTERTGRQLTINGDLQWKLDWPRIRLHAIDVTFANPPWAREKHMIAAPAVDLSVDLPLLFRGKLFVPQMRLDRPVVFLQRGTDGRKNWLLDPGQHDEDARLAIGRLTLDQGRVGYDDPSQETSIVAEISSRHAGTAAARPVTAEPGIVFDAKGKFRGLPFTASGGGGVALGLQDELTPYPLDVVATVGPTSIRAEGTVTSLVKNAAVDVSLALRGGSLADLYALLDIALPETRPYGLAGRLTHGADGWRYEKFSGRIGQSDVGGTLHFAGGAERPLLEGDLAFKALNLADLGPVVGAEGGSPARPTGVPGRTAAVRDAGPGSRALPVLPFRRDRWTTVDADVQLTAQTILRPKALPLERLAARLRMRESVLTLDPLDVVVAGGHLDGVIRLDGQQSPIQAHAKLAVRKLLLAKLLPTVARAQNSVGQINGQLELVGRGDSIARMLATADGKVGLVVEDGKVSKLLMEQVAAHLPEVMLQNITGDQLIEVRCGVADFDVENGVMKVGVLVLDTDVTTIAGTGSVDLAQETLDLTLIPSPKRFSLFALRGPITVRGAFAHPDLAADARRVGARGLAALLLAAINPALAVIALADPGSGKDSDCNALTRKTQSPWLKKSASAEKHAPG